MRGNHTIIWWTLSHWIKVWYGDSYLPAGRSNWKFAFLMKSHNGWKHDDHWVWWFTFNGCNHCPNATVYTINIWTEHGFISLEFSLYFFLPDCIFLRDKHSHGNSDPLPLLSLSYKIVKSCGGEWESSRSSKRKSWARDPKPLVSSSKRVSISTWGNGDV